MSRRQNVVRHINIHLTRSQYQCDLCPKTFQEKSSVLRHMRARHLRNHMQVHESKQFPCDSCPAAFSKRRHLAGHRRMHPGEKHECTKCERKFVLKGSLTRHMKFFHSDIKITCETCGKNYSSSDYLRLHISTIHDNKEKFACDLCGREYKRKNSLLMHIRVHLSGRYQKYKSRKFPKKS